MDIVRTCVFGTMEQYDQEKDIMADVGGFLTDSFLFILRILNKGVAMGMLEIRSTNGKPYIKLKYNDIEALRNGVDDDTYAQFVEEALRNGVVIEKTDGFHTYIIKPAKKDK